MKRKKKSNADNLRRQLRRCVGKPDPSQPGHWRVYVKGPGGVETYAPQYLINAFLEKPNRWKVSIWTGGALGDAVRKIPPETFSFDQACKIDEIRDYVQERQLIQALEMPSAWNIDEQNWRVEVL